MNANQAAFCTITPITIATIGCTVLAATAVSTAATVAAAFFASIGVALSIAAMTGWIAVKDGRDDTAQAYFDKFKSHIGFAVVGVGQFITHTLFTTLIQSGAQAISDLFYGKITGEKPKAYRVL